MAKSRNRKKKQTHINQSKKLNPFFLLQAMHDGINKCRACKTPRKELKFIELPIEQKQIWMQTGSLNSINYFLYCKKCEDYSAIFEYEDF